MYDAISMNNVFSDFSGLQVLGIFRVGSSKKRVKQLQEEFDTGKSITLNESHNPHDVGAMLKEYFRDLPEPLLTRDLYTPFISTRSRSRDSPKRVYLTTGAIIKINIFMFNVFRGLATFQLGWQAVKQ